MTSILHKLKETSGDELITELNKQNAISELEAIFGESPSPTLSGGQSQDQQEAEKMEDNKKQSGYNSTSVETTSHQSNNQTNNQLNAGSGNVIVNHSSSQNSNSSSGYGTSLSGRSTPHNSNIQQSVEFRKQLHGTAATDGKQIKSATLSRMGHLIASDENRTSNETENTSFTLRRERSLDRGSFTDNYLDHLVNNGHTPKRMLNNNNSTQSTINDPNQMTSSFHSYSNSSLLYLESNDLPGVNKSQSSRTSQNNGGGSQLRSSSLLNQKTSHNGTHYGFMPDHSTSPQVYLDQQNVMPSATTAPTQPALVDSGGGSKINFIKDLQIRLMDTQKECYYLKCELQSCQQKLTSSMQSIKQFWSPELKKERQMRKEEAIKYNMLMEQYKLLQAQYHTLGETYDEQIGHVKTYQIQQQQQEESTSKSLMKEKTILKKTINELEMRINAQKQSLATKDDTIKKMFDLIKMLSNKKTGDTSSHHHTVEFDSIMGQLNGGADSYFLKERLMEEEKRSAHLQQLVHQLQHQNNLLMSSKSFNTSMSLNEPSNPLLIESNSASLLMEATNGNESRMKQLEVRVQELQDGLLLSSRAAATGIHSASVSPKLAAYQTPVNEIANKNQFVGQIETLKANEKSLKERIEAIKLELCQKETELQQLKTKYETIENKEKDLQHYVNLLKESINTKDQQINIQQSDINDLRNRIREKDGLVEKKNQQLQSVQLEKHQRDSDLAEMRDQMNIREKKINVLNRKIENLEEQLRDKELNLISLRSKFTSVSSNAYHNNVMQSLEHTLEQKEKLIEQLTKDSMMMSKANHQKSPKEVELVEQIETLNISIKELNEKVDSKNKDIQEYQNEVFDLKDEIDSLKTQLLRKDSHVNSLEVSLTQKNEEMDILEEKIQRLTKQQQLQATFNQNQSNMEVEGMKKQVGSLQKDVHSKEVQIQQLTAELITLKELIDDFEDQKQMLKTRLEQQEQQFTQLEKQFEQTSNDYENRLKDQSNYYEERLKETTTRKTPQVNTVNVAVNTTTQLNKDNEDSSAGDRLKAEHKQAILKLQEKHEQELHQAIQDIKSDFDQVIQNQETQFKMKCDNLVKEIDMKQERIEELEKKIAENVTQLNDQNSQIAKLNDHIKDLEDAIRESVSITGEREYAIAQQKKKTDKIETENQALQEEIASLNKTLDEQKLLFNRYQEELVQREDQLQKLEEEKVREMNELLVTKQEILLSTISEKDATIGELECDRTPANKARIQRLMDEKDNLHQQLKDLNEKRMKLMNDYMAAKEAKDKVKALSTNHNLAHDEDGIYG